MAQDAIALRGKAHRERANAGAPGTPSGRQPAHAGAPAAKAAPAAIPKQIIYPLRYLRPLLSRRRNSELRFDEGLRGLLGADLTLVPLGRARAGIYLLAAHARSEGRDGVVMSPYTIPDVVNMVQFAGCRPVFVDTLPGSTNVDLDHLRTLVDARTCCVLLTHYHVNQERLDDVRELCRRAKVPLFDDCAIALEGEYDGLRMGATTDASVFSMSGFKTLNYVWGGAVATREGEIGAALERQVSAFPRLTWRHYRQHMPAVLKYDLATRGPIFSRYTFPALERQSRNGSGSDMLALLRRETERIEDTVLSRPACGALDELARKMHGVGERLAHRRRIATIYDRSLSGVRVAPETSERVRAGSCYVTYPVLVDTERRDDVFRELMRQGFHVGLSMYPNAHESEHFSGSEGRSRNVAALARSMLTLPTHQKVRPDYAEALAKALTRLL